MIQPDSALKDALVWIATQPIIGPAASWWDMRAKAREALGLPPIALTPEEKALSPGSGWDTPVPPAPVRVVDGDVIPGAACADCED